MTEIPTLRFPQFINSWEKKTLDEVTAWKSGGTPSMKNGLYWDGDIPWISASSMHVDDLHDSDKKITKLGLKNGSRLAKQNSILLLVRGSMLFNRIPVGVTSRDVAFNQDVKSISAANNINNKYLFYWMKAKEHKMLSMVVGTGIGAGKLETDQLKSLELFPNKLLTR
jgi:type I restriction enzyme S subunit